MFGFHSAASPVRLQLEPKAIGGNCNPVSAVTCCTVAPSEVNGHMAVADMDRAPVCCSHTGNKHETHTHTEYKAQYRVYAKCQETAGNEWKLLWLYAKKICFASCSSSRKMNCFKNSESKSR